MNGVNQIVLSYRFNKWNQSHDSHFHLVVGLFFITGTLGIAAAAHAGDEA
jgi:hypothetical protein